MTEDSTRYSDIYTSLKSQQCTWSPKWLQQDRSFTSPERDLYREILTLSIKDGKCKATDKYFAAHMGYKNIASIGNLLTSLEQKGDILRGEEDGHRVIFPLKYLPPHPVDEALNNLVLHPVDDKEKTTSSSRCGIPHPVDEVDLIYQMRLPCTPNKDESKVKVKGSEREAPPPPPFHKLLIFQGQAHFGIAKSSNSEKSNLRR